jgi:hypothetical protein
MRLRDWPARRIRRMWLAGLVAEALLIAVLRFTGEPPTPRPDLRHLGLDTVPAPDSASRAEVEKRLANRGFTITRQPLPSGDTLVRIGRDSSFVAARVGGDSNTIVAASPDVERAAGAIVSAWVLAVEGIVKLLLFLAAVLLPIPILLVSVTLVWAVQRRPRRA